MFIVVFTGGVSPAPAVCGRFFSDIAFAEGAGRPFVIAADSGIRTLEEFDRFFVGIDFSPDIVLGDWDSLGDTGILEKYPAGIIRSHAVDKDFTDTELALEEAHKKSSESSCCVHKIILIGAGGGERIDHLLAVFDLFSTELRPDVWLSGKQFLYFLPERSRAEVFGLGLDDMVSVLRTSESRRGGRVRSEGLLWESGLFRGEGLPSISNRIAPGFFRAERPVTLHAESGNFVLAVPSSARVSVRSLP